MRDDAVVVFLHNARTGGMTLRGLIDQYYRPSAVLNIRGMHPTLDTVAERIAERQAGVRVIEGHVPFGVDRLVDRPCAYVSLVREPTERAVSFYYYSRVRHQQRFGQDPPWCSLAAFVRESGNLEMDNGQTRRLAGMDPPFGAFTRELLERAQDNLLRHFLVFGRTEEFDQFLSRLRQALDWPAANFVRQGVN